MIGIIAVAAACGAMFVATQMESRTRFGSEDG